MKKYLLILALMFPSVANAQLVMRPYIGADYIYTDAKLKYNLSDYNDNNGDSYSVNVGMKISKYLSLEGFYQMSPTAENDKTGAETKFMAYGADFIGYLPMDGRYFNLLTTVGFGSYKFESSMNNFAQYNFGGRVGIGLQYNITRNIGVRAIARHVFIGTDQISSLNEISGGLQFLF